MAHQRAVQAAIGPAATLSAVSSGGPALTRPNTIATISHCNRLESLASIRSTLMHQSVLNAALSRLYHVRHVTIASLSYAKCNHHKPPPMDWKRPTEMAFVGAPMRPVELQRSPTVSRLVGGWAQRAVRWRTVELRWET